MTRSSLIDAPGNGSEDHGPTMLSARWWLCLPPSLLYLLDVAITLAGQEPAYWGGDTTVVYEANPLAYWLLMFHPVVFAASAATWWVLFAALICRLRREFAVVLAFVLTVGHATGAASWLLQGGVPGWLCTAAVFLGAERLVAWSWRRAHVEEAVDA